MAELCAPKDKCLLLHQENLQYRAEGNSSLVVRLIKENCILRIPKIDAEENEIIYCDAKDEDKGCHAVDEALRILQMRKDFAQEVLKPLLGDVYIPNMEIVHLTKEDIKSINSAVQKQRPVYRMHKGMSVLPSGCYALLMPDLCTSLHFNLKTQTLLPTQRSTISVEIKPKQGFLNASEFFLNELDENLVNNFNICKFCLKQFLKVEEGRYKYQSKFCPLDLYSGCDLRMKGSLRELLRNPQNNLRVFKDGQLIFGGEKLDTGLDELWHHLSKCIHVPNKNKTSTYFTIEDELIHLLIKALKWSPNELKCRTVPNNIRENSIKRSLLPFQQCHYSQKNPKLIKCDIDNCCKHALPAGCVLDSILRIQTLGNSSLDTVLPYLDCCNSQSLMGLQCLSNYFTFVSSSGNIFPSNKIPEYLGAIDVGFKETKWQFYTRKIWEYLVSLTVKDCSIIISLQPLNQKLENKYEEHILRGLNGADYLTEVKVVDLDPKPIHNILKNYEANKKLVKAYKSHPDHLR